MQQKIVLSGYYGFKNAGDDAVCYAIIEALREKMPHCDITVLSNEPERTEEAYHVKAVNRWKWREVWRALRKSDLLISGGGSLIQDVTSKNSCLYYLGVIMMSVFSRTPVVVYGQGLGPINEKRNRRLTKMVFNRTRAIFVRDEESHALLRELGVKRPVQVAPDPVLGIDNSVVNRARGLEILTKLGYDNNRPLTLVCLRDWKKSDKVHDFAMMGDILYKAGYEVGFLAMHHEQDELIAQAVSAHMHSPSFMISDHYNTKDLFSIFACSELVVGMRLHALIIGAALERRIMAVSYDPKVDSFMKMVHNPNIVALGDVSGERLTEAVNDCMATENHEAQHRLRTLKRLSRTPANECAEILTNN